MCHRLYKHLYNLQFDTHLNISLFRQTNSLEHYTLFTNLLSSLDILGMLDESGQLSVEVPKEYLQLRESRSIVGRHRPAVRHHCKPKQKTPMTLYSA